MHQDKLPHFDHLPVCVCAVVRREKRGHKQDKHRQVTKETPANKFKERSSQQAKTYSSSDCAPSAERVSHLPEKMQSGRNPVLLADVIIIAFLIYEYLSCLVATNDKLMMIYWAQSHANQVHMEEGTVSDCQDKGKRARMLKLFMCRSGLPDRFLVPAQGKQ